MTTDSRSLTPPPALDREFSPSADAAAPASRPGLVRAVLAFAWRGMLRIKHVPEQATDVTVMPVLMVFMFTFLFGGAIAGSTDAYLQFFLPGVLAMIILFGTVYSGVSVNTDVARGVVDRFRTLPIPRPAPLVGAAVGDLLRFLIAVIVVMGLGVALGYRPDGGLAGVVLGAGLVIIFASGVSWVFTTVGLLMRAPNAVMNAGNMAIFPITFLSNVFVPPETLPGWLEAVVNANPVSHLVTATRGLMDGRVEGLELTVSLATAVVLTVVFAPLSTHLYRRK
ncbi:MAG: ABC transporter permease [Miltoncostaeaceae bacterium]